MSEMDPEGGGRSKSKRVRTTFTEEQLYVLNANFSQDSNPDGQDLERIANLTGLSKRVTQVWFQNMRARHKKHLTSASTNGTPPAKSRRNNNGTLQCRLQSLINHIILNRSQFFFSLQFATCVGHCLDSSLTRLVPKLITIN